MGRHGVPGFLELIPPIVLAALAGDGAGVVRAAPAVAPAAAPAPAPGGAQATTRV